MHKLKLENITRNDQGGYTMHVIVYDAAEPAMTLTRLSVPLASLAEADQQAAVDKITAKLTAWKAKASGHDAVKTAIQAKLDSIS